MAESVDALVSNTNEVTLVPVRLRLWVLEESLAYAEDSFLFLKLADRYIIKEPRPYNS